MLAKAEHAAATERLRLLEKIVARHEAGTKAVLKKEQKKVAAAAAAEAGEPVAKKPRGVWVAWVYGEPSPSDGGDPIPSAAARFPEEHAAFVATLASKRGADINFASEAATATEGDPVGIPKPVAEEGESDEDYAARVEEWRATDGATLWSVDAHEAYEEHVARYKAIVEARSADGSSSKSKRVKLTEEQKLANREARKAVTKAKNEALKLAKAAEKAAKAKPAKAKAPPAVVKNAAKPPVKAVGGAGRPPVVSLTAASDDSDSDSDSSDEEEEEKRAPPPPPPAAKAAAAKKPGPPAPKAAAAGAKKPGPPAPKPKAAPALSLEEEKEPVAAAAAVADEAESGDV